MPIEETQVVAIGRLSGGSILIYNVLAAGMLVVGHLSGIAFVENKFYIGGQDAVLLGAFPGAVIAYGLTLQVALDFARTPGGRVVENMALTCGRVVRPFLFCYRPAALSLGHNEIELPEHAGAAEALLRPSRLLQTPGAVEVLWKQDKTDCLKIIMLRLMHYGTSLFAGVGVIGLPMFFMFHGDDINSESIEIDCYVWTMMGFLMQLGLFLAANRSDNSSGVVIKEIDAEDSDEEKEGEERQMIQP